MKTFAIEIKLAHKDTYSELSNKREVLIMCR